MWSFVFQTGKEASVEGEHSGTADAEVNLQCFQSLDAISVVILFFFFSFCSSFVSFMCFVSCFNSPLSLKSC